MKEEDNTTFRRRIPRQLHPFTVFCILWAFAQWFHLLSFGSWVYSPLGLLRLITLIFFFLSPRSRFRFALMLVADVLYIFEASPVTANHILFTAFVDLSLLIVIGTGAFHRTRGGLSQDAIYLQVKGVLRVELILLYFFAVLHKLNTDYFDPSVSCAGYLLHEMQVRFAFLPVGDRSLQFSIYGTIFLEAAIPVLLCFKRTRNLGIIIALGFHLFLSVHQHKGLYGFSAMMFALLFTCVPDSLVDRVYARLNDLGILDRLTGLGRFHARRVLWGGGIVLIGVLVVIFAADINIRSFKETAYTIGQLLWVPYGLALIALYLMGNSALKDDESRRFLFPCRSWAWIMPVIIFLHSFCPYLGLKTVPCLSMFSNLRTEGPRPNHLFLSQRLQVFDYQNDLVEVISSSDSKLQRLADKKLLIPYFEFCRQVNLIRGLLSVHFVRGSQSYRFKDAGPAARPGVEPTPWVLGKIMAFRPIDKEGPMRCRW